MSIRNSAQFALAATFLFAAVPLASAQQRGLQPVRPGVDPPGPPPAVGAVRDDRPVGPGFHRREAHPASILQSTLIIGAPVTLVGGTRFGTISDLVIDDGGCIEYAVVSYNNRLVPIPWGVTTFNVGRRDLLVDIPRERIVQIPTFTRFSELNDTRFSQRVHTFFRGTMRPDRHQGAGPRDERRFDNGVRPGERAPEPGAAIPGRNDRSTNGKVGKVQPGGTNPGNGHPGAERPRGERQEK